MSSFGFFDGIHTLTALTQPFMKTKHKERVETILEPLQGIIQLAILSKCPVHSKLAITKNNLYIQFPEIQQGIIRWYNNDKKDDLVYIFNIIKRFQLFYKKVFKDRPELYKLLTSMASLGIVQLQKTYDYGMNVTLVQTLKMYNSILLGNVDFSFLEGKHRKPSIGNDSNGSNGSDNDSFFSAESVNHNDVEERSTEHNVIVDAQSVISTNTTHTTKTYNTNTSMHTNTQANVEQENDASSIPNIENVFFHITKIYPSELYDILYNLLVLLEKDAITYNNTHKVIEYLFKSYNIKIHMWIQKNLIY